MSLALTRNNLLRGAITPQPTTPGMALVRVSSPVAPPAPTAPPMGSLKSTGVARSISIGNIIGGLAGAYGGFQTGGIIGGIQGGITGFQSGLGGGFTSTPGIIPSTPGTLPGGAPTQNSGGGIQTTGTAAGGCVTILGQQFCLGGSAGPLSSFQGPGSVPTQAGSLPSGGSTATPAPRGYHVNKHGYWTKAGYVAPGTRWVKNRRRNPLNPRALSHSLSRLAGFTRAVKRTEKTVKKACSGMAPHRRSSSSRSTSRKCGCK